MTRSKTIRTGLTALCIALSAAGVACRPASVDPLDVLALTLSAPDTVRTGGEATFRLTVINKSTRAVLIPIAGDDGFEFDVIVRGRGGVLVWRRLGSVHQDIAKGHTLTPRGQIVLDASWGLRDTNGHPVPPDQYMVEALLVGPDGRTLTASTTPAMQVIQ